MDVQLASAEEASKAVMEANIGAAYCPEKELLEFISSRDRTAWQDFQTLQEKIKKLSKDKVFVAYRKPGNGDATQIVALQLFIISFVAITTLLIKHFAGV